MKCYLLVDQTVDTQQPTPRISPFYAVFRVSICPADFDSGWRLKRNPANPSGFAGCFLYNGNATASSYSFFNVPTNAFTPGRLSSL